MVTSLNLCKGFPGKGYQVRVKIPFDNVGSFHALTDQVLTDSAGNFKGGVRIRDSLKKWPNPRDMRDNIGNAERG